MHLEFDQSVLASVFSCHVSYFWCIHRTALITGQHRTGVVMKTLAKRWYEWRWSTQFQLSAHPEPLDIPPSIQPVFPVQANHTLSFPQLSECCAEFAQLQGSTVSPEAIRLLFVSSQDVASKAVQSAAAFQRNIAGLHRTRKQLQVVTQGLSPYWGEVPAGEYISKMRSQFMIRFSPGENLSELPQFYADVTRQVKKLLLAKKTKRPAALAAARRMFEILQELDEVLGLLTVSSDTFLEQDRQCAAQRNGLDLELIHQMVSRRAVARTGRDWETADKLQRDLNHIGVILADGEAQTDWWIRDDLGE